MALSTDIGESIGSLPSLEIAAQCSSSNGIILQPVSINDATSAR